MQCESYVRHSVLVAVRRSQSWLSRSSRSFLYGLMQCSPYEIKDKLLKALDEDNNVVDMVAVIDVIGLLERTPITKDTLERTRLGKYINELRKKTSNEQLARRAKDLVKSWRRLLPSGEPPVNGAPPTPPVGPGPGPGVGPGPGPGLRVAKLASRSASPSCSSVSNSPVLPAANRTRNGGFKPVSPAAHSPGWAPASPTLAHPSPHSAPDKNNVANKRLRKSEPRKATPNGVHPASWDAIPSGNSAFESVRPADVRKLTSPAACRTQKVKTTQQLIADLRAKSGTNVVFENIGSHPPAGNYSLLGTDDETSRTKSELMDRFLQSSATEPPPAVEIATILRSLPDLSTMDIDLQEGCEEVRPPPQVTPQLVERMSVDKWEFVNGTYNHQGEWRGWQEVTTSESVAGDVLHVLPYVNIDW
ncbi:uncharacterized protein LOC135390574 isoform X2 [Ornithodoros turicata]|uniref:uncharacterized protein LOC135390574 isoform X2 n=1 Tax=Ornithodoros turicata TaxID=34597 RepID=UPI003139C183